MQLGLERLAHGHKLVWLRWRRHIRDNTQDVLRCCHRSLDGALDLPQDTLALVGATDAVVTRGDDTIRGGLKVVGNDDPLAVPTGGFVQRPELPQVAFDSPKRHSLSSAEP